MNHVFQPWINCELGSFSPLSSTDLTGLWQTVQTDLQTAPAREEHCEPSTDTVRSGTFRFPVRRSASVLPTSKATALVSSHRRLAATPPPGNPVPDSRFDGEATSTKRAACLLTVKSCSALPKLWSPAPPRISPSLGTTDEKIYIVIANFICQMHDDQRQAMPGMISNIYDGKGQVLLDARLENAHPATEARWGWSSTSETVRVADQRDLRGRPRLAGDSCRKAKAG
ncbi:hypothetical protein FN846DRAFT_903514 [Sphaerosporella brunnea]|uniref:Uncharacterized protein n=1 Tax=Sphaerosporella brunnea TaxID=1250544 RepID=A0A5J5F7D1_9PEZI|nr:hypothetical protein FN846DRAFT_903514 [Sphaerosporella brunnea]